MDHAQIREPGGHADEDRQLYVPEAERLSAEDEEILQRLVRRHYEYTRSARADDVLRKWNSFAPKFVKVFPKDLKLALEARINAGTGNG